MTTHDLGSAKTLATWLDRIARLAWFLGLLYVPFLGTSLGLLTLATRSGDPPGLLAGVFVQAQPSAPGIPLTGIPGDTPAAKLVPIQGIVVADSGTTAEMVALGVEIVFTIGLWLLTLYRIKAITGELRAGRPFVAANARHLRWVGFSVCGLWLVDVAMQVVAQRMVAARYTIEGASFPVMGDPHLQTLFLGVLFLVISQVFRVGTMLQEDHDATI